MLLWSSEAKMEAVADVGGARAYAIVVLAWFLATCHVLSDGPAPDSVGPPGAVPAAGAAPGFRPWPVLMQPVYTLFYTLVLTSLFSMAWAEHDARFGAGPGRSELDYAARFGFVCGDSAAFRFVAGGAAACGAGLALGVAWGVYLRRVAPPRDHKEMRLSVFYYCCGQLALALLVTASLAAAAREV